MFRALFVLSMFFDNLAFFAGIMLAIAPGAGPGWAFMTEHIGRTMMALPFLVVSLLSLIGFRRMDYLRASLFGGSGLMVVWALASFWAWSFWGQGSPISALFLLHVAVLKYALAIWVPRFHILKELSDKVDEDDRAIRLDIE